jgi:hypothetical protein
MYASDFVRLYSLLSKIEGTACSEFTPEFIGKLRAEAYIARIAIDICVLPKIQNVEILNEVSTCKQSTDVNGSSGSDGVSV